MSRNISSALQTAAVLALIFYYRFTLFHLAVGMTIGFVFVDKYEPSYPNLVIFVCWLVYWAVYRAIHAFNEILFVIFVFLSFMALCVMSAVIDYNHLTPILNAS